MNLLTQIVTSIHRRRPEDGLIGAMMYLTALLIANMISILFMASTFFSLDLTGIDLTHNPLFRFALGPIVLIAISVILFLVLKRKKDEIEIVELNKKERKIADRNMKIYVVTSILLLFLSIASPLIK